MTDARHPRNFPRAQILFGLRVLVSAALLIWLVLEFDWVATWQAMSRISLLGIGVLVLGLLLNRLLAFYRFWILLRSEEVAISLGTVIRVSFLAAFAGNFLPTTVGGDVAKIGWLVSKGYPTWRMAIWTLFDRLSNMLAVGLLAPFCLLLPFVRTYTMPFLGGWAADEQAILRLSAFLFVVVSLAVFFFLGFSNDRQEVPLSVSAADAPQTFGIFPKARLLYKKLSWRKRTFGILAFISLVSIAPNLLGTWYAALDLGMQVSLWEVTAIYVVLYFVTLLPISLNGLGLQEVSTVVLYMSLGASESQAVALAVLLRFAIWITTLPGAYWLSRGIAVSNPAQEPGPARAQPTSELNSSLERPRAKSTESE